MIKTLFSKISDGSCSLGSKDDEKRSLAMVSRTKLLRDQFNICSSRLLTPRQEHMTVHVVTEACLTADERPSSDALVTAEPGIAIGVLSADCLTVLLGDEDKKIAAAAHMPRENLIEDYMPAIVDEMRKLGAENIQAFIGPCLQKQSHFLENKQASKVMGINPLTEEFMEEGSWQECGYWDDGYFFDYTGFAIHQLKACGIENIKCSDIDTYANQDYFSFRRRAIDDNRGLMLSAIHIS